VSLSGGRGGNKLGICGGTWALFGVRGGLRGAIKKKKKKYLNGGPRGRWLGLGLLNIHG